jgi:hypothetical protein
MASRLTSPPAPGPGPGARGTVRQHREKVQRQFHSELPYPSWLRPKWIGIAKIFIRVPKEKVWVDLFVCAGFAPMHPPWSIVGVKTGFQKEVDAV